MDTQRPQSNSFKVKSGQDVARYIVYFSKLKQRWIDEDVNIANISGAGLYKKHRSDCDKCLLLQSKYKIDLVKYLKFFVSKFRAYDENIRRINDPQTVMWYADELQILGKYEKVYGYILKSIDNIVDDCIRENYSSAKEYIKHLIVDNKLAEKYLSGRISQYYLAGIRSLPKLVRTMDGVSKDTLSEVVSQQDKLYSDMQDAFTYFKTSRISIISFTNDKLNERLEALSKNKKQQG